MLETIAFPMGIPGFEANREWSFVQHANHPAIGFLKSLASSKLRLILVSALAVDENYELTLEPCDSEALIASETSSLATYFVVCLQGGCASVNMLAPIVIHQAMKRGVQAVRSDRKYSHAAPLVLTPATEPQPC